MLLSLMFNIVFNWAIYLDFLDLQYLFGVLYHIGVERKNR